MWEISGGALGNRIFWMAGFGGSHSALTAQASSLQQGAALVQHLTYHSYSFNGFYSDSDGAAVFTPTAWFSPEWIAAIAIRARFHHRVRIESMGSECEHRCDAAGSL